MNSKTRVVYIPGNHDPPDLFRDVMEEDTANEKKDNQPSEVELAVKELGVNLHQRVIRIGKWDVLIQRRLMNLILTSHYSN